MSAHTFTPECLPRDTRVCLCLSGPPQTFTFYVPAHFNTLSEKKKTKRVGGVHPAAIHRSARRVYALLSDNQDGVYTAAGRSSLALFGLWLQCTAAAGLVVFSRTFSSREVQCWLQPLLFPVSSKGAQEEIMALILKELDTGLGLRQQGTSKR